GVLTHQAEFPKGHCLCSRCAFWNGVQAVARSSPASRPPWASILGHDSAIDHRAGLHWKRAPGTVNVCSHAAVAKIVSYPGHLPFGAWPFELQRLPILTDLKDTRSSHVHSTSPAWLR